MQTKWTARPAGRCLPNKQFCVSCDCLSSVIMILSLQNRGRFGKLQAGVSREELAVVSIAQITKKVDLPLSVWEKFRIEFACIESRHRSAIQPEGARGQYEVGGLQRTVAEGGLVNEGLVPDKVGAHIKLWKEPGKILVEFRVPGDDGGNRSGHGLFDIAGSQSRLKSRLCPGCG